MIFIIEICAHCRTTLPLDLNVLVQRSSTPSLRCPRPRVHLHLVYTFLWSWWPSSRSIILYQLCKSHSVIAKQTHFHHIFQQVYVIIETIRLFIDEPGENDTVGSSLSAQLRMSDMLTVLYCVYLSGSFKTQAEGAASIP